MWKLNDTQLTLLVVVVLIILFVLGDCKLTCGASEGYTSKHFTGPTTAYADWGGNMLHGWARNNSKIVGDYHCSSCMQRMLGQGMSHEDAAEMCIGTGDCSSSDFGC